MRRSFFAVLLTFACLLGSGEARAASLELQVVSYNVYMVPITAPARAERLEKLPDEIAELSPDVVLLQEVWSEADSASLEASLKRRGLSHVFRAASAAPFAYASSGMLIASRYPITAAQRRSFSLGRYPHTPYHLDWIGRKGALDVRIQTPLGPVRFVDTHLQASYRTGSYEPVRISQALELASWLTDTSLPLVVAGDFNARQDWPSCRVFRERAGVRLPKGRWRVDQILLRDGDTLALTSMGVKRVLQDPVLLADGSRRRLSDHRAVVMSVRLEQKSAGQATPPRLDPSIEDQAGQVLRDDLRRTRRQQWAGFACLPLCLFFGVWGARRVRKARGRLWALLALVSAFAGTWVAYFLIGYVPHRRAGIERALASLGVKRSE